jgi:hypothetical protein
MRIFSVAAAFCIASSTLCAQTVVPDTNIKFGLDDFDPGYLFMVDKTNAPPGFPRYTSVVMKYNAPTIEVIDWTVDAGSDWYLVKPGDAFSPQNIQAGLFLRMFEVLDGPPHYAHAAVDVGLSDFWLGVATSYSGPRTVFGWVHLQPTSPTELTMLANAISYNSPGIIVGTTTLVPEPTVTVFMAIGLPIVLNRRRK